MERAFLGHYEPRHNCFRQTTRGCIYVISKVLHQNRKRHSACNETLSHQPAATILKIHDLRGYREPAIVASLRYHCSFYYLEK